MDIQEEDADELQDNIATEMDDTQKSPPANNGLTYKTFTII